MPDQRTHYGAARPRQSSNWLRGKTMRAAMGSGSVFGRYRVAERWRTMVADWW